MKKIICEIDGVKQECVVVENLGYQGGVYAKVVKVNSKERIVQKDGSIWRTRTVKERFD